MKETLKELVQVLIIIATVFGFLIGYTMIGITMYKNMGEHWYTALIGLILMIICVIVGNTLPKLPTKDERLDNLEEWNEHIRESWYERFGENL